MLFFISLLGLRLRGENVPSKPVLRLAYLQHAFPEGPWMARGSLLARRPGEFHATGVGRRELDSLAVHR